MHADATSSHSLWSLGLCAQSENEEPGTGQRSLNPGTGLHWIVNNFQFHPRTHTVGTTYLEDLGNLTLSFYQHLLNPAGW